MKKGKVLLVWDGTPEEFNLYVFDPDSEIAKVAIASAGQYINVNNEEGDAVEKLNEMLPNYKNCKVEGHLADGPFSKVVVAGFVA